jgi:putative ABC transport system permease protein
MLRNFLIIAIRSFLRNKATTSIHLSGLALGIATFLLVALFVTHETGYDRYNKKADRIVRVIFHGRMNGSDIKEANVMPPVAATLKANFPEVLDAVRLRNDGIHRISYRDKTFREDHLDFADSNFFRVFSLPLLEGDPRTALVQPNSVVISRTIAKKYFGTEDPIGKVLQFPDDKGSLTVTGLFDRVPENSHFHFDLLGSMASLPESRSTSFMSSNFFTYLELPEGYDPAILRAKLPAIVDRYMGPEVRQAFHQSMDQFRKGGNNLALELQPLTSIHLHSDLTGEMEPNGDIRYVYIFSVVGVFMLLIACINFVNLSTASAGKRAKEVGIRKVLGSMRGRLIGQFLAESLLLTSMGTILAVGLVYWALPFFNQLAGQDLTLHWQSNPWLLPFLLLFTVFTGLLAGSYPAFLLSGFRPVAVLKGLFSLGGKNAGLRGGLVVFQFFISITLIIGTLVVYRQLNYISRQKLGYDRDQVLIIQETGWLGTHQDLFRQRLLEDPRVSSVTASGYLPAGSSYGNNFLLYADHRKDYMINGLRYQVDDQYLPTLGMELVAGRNFSRTYGADSAAMLINETTARTFGWIDSSGTGAAATAVALDHTLTSPNSDGRMKTYHVIGVIKDFHFRSFHERITPLVMTLDSGAGSNLIVRFKGRDTGPLLALMGSQWKSLGAQAPFSYSFLDKRFEQTYRSEVHIGVIMGIFAGLTIFVACLGLFGLATFSAERRTKEIGIRKVLGASSATIVALLSREFLLLVGLSFLIAAPVAWLAMDRWLRDFAYRITITWTIFGVAALAALAIALLPIGFRALHAARANPIDSLRSE